MDAFDIALDTNLERSYATKPIMDTLAAPPYNYQWDGISSGNYGNMIQGVEDQVVALAVARAATSMAASLWDIGLDGLISDAQVGTRLAKQRYKSQLEKLEQFDGLVYRPAGRDGRQAQAVDFEAAWQTAEPAWTFKVDPLSPAPALTLAAYSARRAAIAATAHVNHALKKAFEGHERSKLHGMADALNRISVDWYDTATAQFDQDTVPGMLIRTIPTTYDPNRVPGQLRFTSVMSGAPNTMHLVWRAARGERFYLRAKGPGATEFVTILNGVDITEWLGLALAPGAWELEGYATNEHGQGATSEKVTVTVAQALAA